MTSLIFDLESNSKSVDTVTKLWCLSYCFLHKPDRIKTITSHGGSNWVMHGGIANLFQEAKTLIGHNIIAYDLPVLAKLVFKCNVSELYKRYKIVDTLVMSRALDPDRESGHSLDAYGKLMGGNQKVIQTTWDKWDDNYISRCEGDVELTYRTLQYLQKEAKRFENYR